jgi:hypothetical protein
MGVVEVRLARVRQAILQSDLIDWDCTGNGRSRQHLAAFLFSLTSSPTHPSPYVGILATMIAQES